MLPGKRCRSYFYAKSSKTILGSGCYKEWKNKRRWRKRGKRNRHKGIQTCKHSKAKQFSSTLLNTAMYCCWGVLIFGSGGLFKEWWSVGNNYKCTFSYSPGCAGLLFGVTASGFKVLSRISSVSVFQDLLIYISRDMRKQGDTSLYLAFRGYNGYHLLISCIKLKIFAHISSLSPENIPRPSYLKTNSFWLCPMECFWM